MFWNRRDGAGRFDGERRAARPRGGSDLARRMVALGLAEILCFQSLMGTGVAQALADSVDSGATAVTRQAPQGGDARDPSPSDASDADAAAGGDAGAVSRESVEWSGRAGAVTVDTASLELDEDALEGIADLTGELPEGLPAVLKLEVSVSDEVAVGDTLALRLPAGVTADASALPSQAKDADGSVAGELAIASDDKDDGLVVTFAGGPHPDGVSLKLEIPVDADVSLLGDAPSRLAWSPAGEGTSASIDLPSLADVLGQLGLLDEAGEDGAQASGEDASEEAAPGPSAPSAQAADAGEPASKVELVTNRGVEEQASFTTLWADNNSDLRPSAEDLEAAHEYRAYFQVEGDSTYYPLTEADGVTVSADAVRLLGYTQAALDAARGHEQVVRVDRTSTNEYTASTVRLPGTYVSYVQATDEDGGLLWETDHNGEPKLDADGNRVPVWTSSEHKVTYAVRHEVVGRQYLYPDSSGESRYQVASSETYGEKYVKAYERECIQLMEDVTFNFKFKMDTDRNLSAAEWATRWASLQTLTVTKKGQSEAQFTIEGKQWAQIVSRKDNRFTPEWTNDDHTTGKISALVPAWHPDGSQLDYSLTQSALDQDESDEYEDFYQVWYDNSTAPNHGDDTSALYNGGTLNVTHAGTTHFSATKRWLDDDAGARPDTSYSLWRYSAGSGSYATATEVRVGEGNVPVEFTVSAAENAAAGTDGIDLGQRVMDLVREQGATLAKYDPDGIPYVYVLREDPPANDYERLNGSEVDQESGDPTGDTGANYYDFRGTGTVAIEGFSRESGDTGTYNGGTLINRRSAKTPVSVTKTWNAGAFQDQLRDVVVTFKLQRILKKYAVLNGGVWEPKGTLIDPDDPSMGTYRWNDDIDGQYYLDDVSGWYAEKLTQTLSGTFNRYDKNGEEWVYRWVEVNVIDPTLGEGFGFFDDSTGQSMFPLWLADSNGSTEFVWFTGAYDHDTGTIVNSYIATTDQYVDKLWAKLDENGNPVLDEDGNQAYTQDERPNGKDVPAITVRVFRDGALYGTATLDGKVDEQATPIRDDDASAGTVRESSPWHLDLEGLPKYDEEGREYSYLVLEGEAPGYLSQHEYDPGEHVTTIRNNPVGEGESSVARVSKSWKDDGNATSRMPVTVGVYADRDLSNSDGSVTYAKDELIGTVELSEANGWYAELGIGVGGLSYGDGFYVRELSDDSFDVVTRDEAASTRATDLSDALLSWPAQNPANPWNEVLFAKTEDGEDNTGKFAYQVSYGTNEEMGCAEVTNRRVGQVWIDLKKEWVDQGADPAARPRASFVISCDEVTNVFRTDENGYVYAVLDDGDQARYVRNGKRGADGVEGIMQVGVDGVDVVDGNLVVPVSNEDEYEASVDALPKYDATGAVVHYRVTEQWADGHGDYSSSQTGLSEDYTSRWHIRDSLSYSFTNRRSATKDVTFHMKWYDAYVKEDLNQRPDVYLTLYKTVYLYNEDGTPKLDADGRPAFTTQLVTGYENYKWRPTAEEGKDARYNEYAVIGDLPKYDEHGREIVYYATAAMSASSGSVTDLDYERTWFTYSANDDDPGNPGWDKADAEVSAAKKRVLVGEGQADSVDDGYAVREDGTFNFRISNDLTVRGYKYWTNLPGNFDESDLPDISIYLQRRLAGGSYGPDGAWQAGAPTPWSDLSVTGEGRDYEVKSYDDPDVAEGRSVADGRTAVAWTHGLTRVSANHYEFSMGSYGLNGDGAEQGGQALPKYDENGRRYEYRVQEVVDGLLADGDATVPGGTTAGSGTPGGSVFKPIYSENAYSVSNVYNPVEGRLTVKKLYDGRQEGDKFPDVTFRLYRYYVTGEGKKSAAEQVATKVLRADDVTSADGGVRGEGTVTFDGLDVYAPNGQYWVYYVTEFGVDGYGARVGTGDLDLGDQGLHYAIPSTSNEYASDDLADVPASAGGEGFGNPTSTRVAQDDTVDVTFANTFDDDDLIELTGTKHWYDQGNAFGTRPEGVTLRLVRTYQDGTPDAGCGNADGEVELQESDPDAPGYVSWSKAAGSDTWTYAISGLEQYAPDGHPWRYTVSEVTDPDGQYSVSGSSKGGTVSAAPDATLPQISNYLNTKVSVTKAWDDTGDEWAQRPTVIAGLQLRFRAEGDEAWSEWSAAGDALADLGVTDASGNPLASVSGKAFEQELNAANGWHFEWNDVPTEALLGDASYELEWRCVETALVYDSAAGDGAWRVEVASPSDDGTYGTYQPYQPSQTTEETTNSQGDVVFRTTVTNALATTSLVATKAWDDDSNKWGSRPGTTAADDAWSVTYALQRTTEGASAAGDAWSWVTRHGAPVDADELIGPDGSLNELLVTATISGTGDSASATFDNLPACDADGRVYAYRLVELVHGSYGVSGASTLATSADGRTSLVVAGAAQGAGGQSFRNVLQSVSVSGRKLWNDWGSGLAPDFSAAPSVRLELQRSLDGVTWTGAKLADGTAPTPTWTRNGLLDWTFAYEGLPKTDQSGATYRYRVREVGNVSNGFVDSYADDASVDAATGDVTTATITNTATRFSLDKVGDGTTGSDGEPLAGVTLKVRGASDGKTYAVWTRDLDDEGNLVTRSYVSLKGVSETADALTDLTPGAGFIEMTGDNAGLIVGLRAGAYVIHESRVPKGHLRAADATFTLDWGGSVASLRGATMDVRGNVGYVTMTDPVLRGNVELYKYYQHGGSEVALPGMTFDLYQGDAADPESAVKVASGIAMGATKADGAGRTYLWTSGPLGAGNDKIAVERDAEGNSVLGKYFQTLADGLPEGSYFLRETGESHLVETSRMTVPFAVSAPSGATSQPSYVYLKASNAEFNAGVTLSKTDSETGMAVDGATFELWYRAPQAQAFVPVSRGLQTGSAYAASASGTSLSRTGSASTAGALEVFGLKKGDYRLVEVSDTGYAIDADEAPTATWTIADGDKGRVIDLASEADGATWEHAALAGGTLANAPLHADVVLAKDDADTGDGLDGAGFTLQTRGADGLADVAAAGTLLTGHAYQLVVDADGSITGSTELEGEGEPGRLILRNLPWGTYRLVESAALPGYATAGTGGTDIATEEFTVQRSTFSESPSGVLLDLGTVTNSQTDLAVRKTDADGSQGLAGATFTLAGNFADGAATRTLVTGEGGLAAPATDADSVRGQLLVGETYVLTETVPPEGYGLPETASVRLTVAADGAVSLVGDAPDAWSLSTSDGLATVTAADAPTKVMIRKVDGEGRALSGATFTITGEFSDGTASKVVSPQGPNATFVSEGLLLAGHEYAISETAVPAGYARVPDARFRVSDDGSHVALVGQARGWSADDGGLTLTAQDEATRLTLAKSSAADGTALPGATFVVSGSFATDGEAVQGDREVTTGPDGTFELIGLVAGTDYVVTEKAAPAGFIPRGGSWTVRIDEWGEASLVSGGEGASLEGTTLAVTDEPISLSFAKTDEDGTPLSGALFSITGVFADGSGALLNDGQPLTYGSRSAESLSELHFVQGQTYELTETHAPDGYELVTGEALVSVDTDGRVTIDASGVGNGAVTVGEDGVTVTAADRPIGVTLAKADVDGTPLAGATFAVRPSDGGTFADGTRELTVTTGEDGRATVQALLVAGRTYEVEETQAPEGRKRLSGTILVTVNADGTLSSVDPQPAVSNGSFSVGGDDGATLTVTDEAVPFSITKCGTDSDGHIDPDVTLAGARFSVTGAFAGERDERTVELVTGEDGTAGSELAGMLVVGRRYVIREVEAPAGYVRIQDALDVIVNDDGTLSPVGSAPSEYQLMRDGSLLVLAGGVMNRESRLAVTKASAANPLVRLSGATFQITCVEGTSFAREVEGAALTATTWGGSDPARGDYAGWAEFDRGALRADDTSVYVLRETQAPAGYELNANELFFKLMSDGSVVPLASADPDDLLDADAAAALGFAVTGEGSFTVAATDEPIEASLVKVGVGADGGQTPLAGAAFTLSCADGTNDAGEPNRFADGSETDVYELVTESDGSVAIPSATLAAGNAYELEETVAPAGYGLVAGTLTFRVAPDGTLEIIDGPDAYALLGDGQVGIRLADEPTRLTVSKRGSDGAPASAMAGAVFEVEPDEGFAFADGTTGAIRLEVGGDGLAPELVGVLDTGAVYTFREVEAPAGYALLGDGCQVAVRQDGSVALADEATARACGWELAERDGSLVLTATDEPLPPDEPASPDEPGASPEAGAGRSGGTGAPFTGDATTSAVACLVLSGGLALVALGLRRRRRHA